MTISIFIIYFINLTALTVLHYIPKVFEDWPERNNIRTIFKFITKLNFRMLFPAEI